MPAYVARLNTGSVFVFEFVDVVISALGAALIGRLAFVSSMHVRNETNSDAAPGRKRKASRLKLKEPKELATIAWTNGIAVFVFFVFLAAVDLSQVAFWLRTLIKGTCLVALLLSSRALAAFVFRLLPARHVG